MIAQLIPARRYALLRAHMLFYFFAMASRFAFARAAAAATLIDIAAAMLILASAFSPPDAAVAAISLRPLMREAR